MIDSKWNEFGKLNMEEYEMKGPRCVCGALLVRMNGKFYCGRCMVDFKEENKYAIGSQWRTYNNKRAVVVSKNLVWYEDDNKVHGFLNNGLSQYLTTYNLMEPWVEKVNKTVWVHLVSGGVCYQSSDKISNPDVVARIKVTITEGQFDE